MGGEPPPTVARVPYAGIATRAVALAIDAVVANAIFIVGAALIGLIGTLVGEIRPQWLVSILVGAGWALTVGAYFVGFWSVTGQTPGMRLMHLRVLVAAGTPPGFWRSVVRLVGLVLSIIPLFLGFVPVLVDDRRRGLADFLARTVVVYADRAIEVEAEAPEVALVPPDVSGQFG
jgi:uncharacterized RDD family membrane protein YckC